MRDGLLQRLLQTELHLIWGYSHFVQLSRIGTQLFVTQNAFTSHGKILDRVSETLAKGSTLGKGTV